MCWLELRFKMTHIKPGERAGFCTRPIGLRYRSRSFAKFVWVLRRGYKRSAADVASAIRRLINSVNVVTNRLALAVEAGLSVLEAGGDFADGVIAYEGTGLVQKSPSPSTRRQSRCCRQWAVVHACCHSGYPSSFFADRKSVV